MTKPTCPECGSDDLTATVLSYGTPTFKNENNNDGLLTVEDLSGTNEDVARVICESCTFQAGQVRVNWPAAKHFKKDAS